jgi:ABC-type multidrug transport system ATPase subunit
MVLLDEPSMGLAPQIVDEVFGIVKDLKPRRRVSFLLAEQNTNMALRYADFGYILENGRVVMEGAAKDLANNEDVKEFYLGISSGERKSFRESSTIAAASAGSLSRLQITRARSAALLKASFRQATKRRHLAPCPAPRFAASPTFGARDMSVF